MKTLRLLTLALCFSSIACAGANHSLRNVYPALVPTEQATLVELDANPETKQPQTASRTELERVSAAGREVSLIWAN